MVLRLKKSVIGSKTESNIDLISQRVTFFVICAVKINRATGDALTDQPLDLLWTIAGISHRSVVVIDSRLSDAV